MSKDKTQGIGFAVGALTEVPVMPLQVLFFNKTRPWFPNPTAGNK